MATAKKLKSALTSELKKQRGQVVVHEVIPEYEVVVQDMLATLREGGSVSAFARNRGMSASNLRKYAWAHYRDEYEKAQKESADALAEAAVAASSQASVAQEEIETTYADGSTMRAVKKFDNVQRSKLAAESFWKMAAAKDPERYGAKAGSNDTTSIASEIIEARKRISQS